jgi:hypothetical protein
MRSISRVGVLLLSLVAGQAWAECGDAGQGNFDCSNFVNGNAPGGFTTVTLDVVYENPNNQKEVKTWTTLGLQPDRIIGFGGSGNRCAWEYNDAQTTGGGLTLDGNKSFSALIGCSDTDEKEPSVVPVVPIDTGLDGCDIDVTVSNSNVAGAISGVAFGPDTLAVCTINGEDQYPCVSFCRETTNIPSSCATAAPDSNGRLPYDCRRCEASKDFPNEQGLPYCVEYVNSYCEVAGDPGCLDLDTATDPTLLDTLKPRAIGETTVVVSQEYKSSECGLISVTLGGREYSRWVPCQ